MTIANIGGSVAGALVGGLFGGGGDDEEQQVTQTNEPWSGIQQYLLDLYGRGQGLSNQAPPTVQGQQYFPYVSTTAFRPDEKTLTGLKGQLAYASNYLPGMVEGSYGSFYDMLNAPNVAGNPYIQQMLGQQMGAQTEALRQASGDITDTLTREWLPQIRSGAVGSGQYGGSRQGIAEGLALGEANDQLTDYATNAARALSQSMAQTQLGAYGQGLDQQAKGMALAPQIAQMGFLPSQAWQDVGGSLDAFRQAQINDAMSRWNLAQTEAERVPALNYNNQWLPLQNQNQLLTGASAYGTQTTTGQGPNNTLANVVGGGLLGSSLGGQVGNWLGGMPASVSSGYGTQVGGGYGGMAPIYSTQPYYNTGNAGGSNNNWFGNPGVSSIWEH